MYVLMTYSVKDEKIFEVGLCHFLEYFYKTFSSIRKDLLAFHKSEFFKRMSVSDRALLLVTFDTFTKDNWTTFSNIFHTSQPLKRGYCCNEQSMGTGKTSTSAVTSANKFVLQEGM